MPWTLILPPLGVIVGAVVTYLAARRKTSGRVDTSDAATLWDEASKMRDAYREEAKLLREEIVALKVEIKLWMDEATGLRREVFELREELEGVRQTGDRTNKMVTTMSGADAEEPPAKKRVAR